MWVGNDSRCELREEMTICFVVFYVLFCFFFPLFIYNTRDNISLFSCDKVEMTRFVLLECPNWLEVVLPRELIRP